MNMLQLSGRPFQVPSLVVTTMVMVGLLMLSAVSPKAYSAPPELANPQKINWQRLPLTGTQQEAIKKHDAMWQRAFEQLYPEIIAERRRLRGLLLQKDTDHEAIFQTLKHLEDKEQELRYEAVKNFLQKKQELRPDQLKMLQQDLP
jgi:Spy/CpxP family protein refolding chaperone